MGGDLQWMCDAGELCFHADAPREAKMEIDEVVVVGGGSVISAMTGSKGVSAGGTEISRQGNSGTESGGGALCWFQ